MLTIHIFGKSDGCARCAALKRKVASVIGEDDYRGKFAVTFHDVLTEEGLVDFCRSNINPNSLPGLVIGIGELFAVRTKHLPRRDRRSFVEVDRDGNTILHGCVKRWEGLMLLHKRRGGQK